MTYPSIKIESTSILCLLQDHVIEKLLEDLADFEIGFFNVYTKRLGDDFDDEIMFSFSSETGFDENKAKKLVTELETILSSKTLSEIQLLNNSDKTFKDFTH